eukprot:5363320-Amphidinium_carterae.1
MEDLTSNQASRPQRCATQPSGLNRRQARRGVPECEGRHLRMHLSKANNAVLRPSSAHVSHLPMQSQRPQCVTLTGTPTIRRSHAVSSVITTDLWHPERQYMRMAEGHVWIQLRASWKSPFEDGTYASGIFSHGFKFGSFRVWVFVVVMRPTQDCHTWRRTCRQDPHTLTGLHHVPVSHANQTLKQ